MFIAKRGKPILIAGFPGNVYDDGFETKPWARSTIVTNSECNGNYNTCTLLKIAASPAGWLTLYGRDPPWNTNFLRRPGSEAWGFNTFNI